MYFYNLIQEIRIWIGNRNIALKNEDKLAKEGLKIDPFGRLYTIINLPEEIANNQFAREPYVLQELRKYDNILIELNLADAVYPVFEKTEVSSAYLLILEGPREQIGIWPFIKYTMLYAVYGVAIYYTYQLASFINTTLNLF